LCVLSAIRHDAAGGFVDSVEFAYDALGNVLEEKTVAQEADGSLRENVIRYGYDKNGELVGRNDSFSGERRYQYDGTDASRTYWILARLANTRPISFCIARQLGCAPCSKL